MYYSFIRHDPDDYAGHNALAAASYVMIFAVYLVMIATGLALYTVDASVELAVSDLRFFDAAVRRPADGAAASITSECGSC